MRDASRRLALAALLALAAAWPAAAADKISDTDKVFPFLEAYLRLPPAERSHFTMQYYFHIGPQPLTAPVWFLDGDNRAPIPLRADGRLQRLPSLEEVKRYGKVAVGVDEKTKLGITIGIEPIVAPATELDARELAAAIAQAAVGQKKVGGIMALAMPKLQEIAFIGAASGEVEFADGRRAPLPLVKGVPTYNPTTLPNARRLRFPKAPSKLDMG
jgi:hypothetical protein